MKPEEMFTDRHIRYGLGRTINLGNFENIRVYYGEEARVNEGIDMDKARDALKELVTKEIEKEVEELTPPKTKVNPLPRGKAGYVP